MIRLAISESEILEELRKCEAPEVNYPDAYTSEELSEALDVSITTIQRRLKKLNKQALVETVRVERMSTDGRIIRVPAYRVKSSG